MFTAGKLNFSPVISRAFLLEMITCRQNQRNHVPTLAAHNWFRMGAIVSNIRDRTDKDMTRKEVVHLSEDIIIAGNNTARDTWQSIRCACSVTMRDG